MSHIKILCLLATFMIFYLVYHRCNISNSNISNSNIEGLDNEPIIDKHCNDDPTWFVEDSSGKKNTCSDIGKTVSCYDMDGAQREGWERCLKSCGNCAKTTVTQLPMNILAGFTGDPIEDFGVVLNMDADRQWVGKQDGEDDVRGYVDEDKDEEISDLYESISSLQDIVDLISGNVKSCNVKEGTCIGDNKTFAGCNGQCVACPSQGIPTPTESHSYIKQSCEGKDFDENCAIQFPAMDISCSNVDKILKKEPDRKQMYPYKYEGCFNNIDNSDGLDKLVEEYKCDTDSKKCVTIAPGKPIDQLNQCSKICSGKYNGGLNSGTDHPILLAGISEVDKCCDDGDLRPFGDESGTILGCSRRKSDLNMDWYPPFSLHLEENTSSSCCKNNNCDTDTASKDNYNCYYKLHPLTKNNHPDCTELDRCYKDDPINLPSKDKFFTKEFRNIMNGNTYIHLNSIVHTQDSNKSNYGKGIGLGTDTSDREKGWENTLPWGAETHGKCYIMGKPMLKGSPTYMGLNKVGNDVQCRCGDPDNGNDDAFLNEKYRQSDSDYTCGIDGTIHLTVDNGNRPNINSVYSLINDAQQPNIDIYDYYYPKEGVFETTHNSCKDYFLFDKIIDNDDDDDDDDDDVGKQAKKDKNKISLYDMCPKQCNAPECKKK